MNAIEVIVLVCFWACLGGAVYTYLGYPIFLYTLSWLFGRRLPPPVMEADLPNVSILIAAYNEESFIQSRLENALAIDYPADKRQIVVATDGCTDRTTEIARRYTGRGVRVLDFPKRRGKATVLNAAIPAVSDEVVILSDANTYMDPQAVRRLVRWFLDPRVGIVCGRLILTDPESGNNADSLYWKYETFLKRCEGRLGALLGANGGIYAIRRALYTSIPADTIIDDFVIPLETKLRTGCSIVYDTTAEAREETPVHIRTEFGRRARIGAGAFQSLQLLWRLLNPTNGWIAFTFFSHKLLRWLCPFFLVGLLASNVFLADRHFYLAFLATQVLFYLVAVVMPFLPVELKVLKPLRLPTMFAGMNAALLLGFWRWLWGRQPGAWVRTTRVSSEGSLS